VCNSTLATSKGVSLHDQHPVLSNLLGSDIYLAFSVFSWFFLGLLPVMVVRDIDMQGHLRWPFYILSTLSLM
jgi:hypothetical protein